MKCSQYDISNSVKFLVEGNCLALLLPRRRNSFRKSQQTSLVAIGLQKPYAKTNVGKSCACMMFIDSVDGC
jgi:hypothetical protein